MAFLIKNYLFKNKKYTVIKTKNLVPWNIYFNRFFIILQVKIFKKYKKFKIINFLNYGIIKIYKNRKEFYYGKFIYGRTS